MSKIEINAIKQLYAKGKTALVDAFADQAQALFDQYGISESATRINFFLAQIGHESAGLTLVEENLNYSAESIAKVWPNRYADAAAAAPLAHNPEALADAVYGDRMGNTHPGDGWLFHGRGLIQLTGRDAYETVGNSVNLPLQEQPELALDPQHALAVACGFWKWKGLNALCDGGSFEAVTKRINGGTNGMPERQAWLAKAQALEGSSDIPAAAVIGRPQIASVQQALLDQGFAEIGKADGISGKLTQAAITQYRQDKGLPEGGIDAELMEALGITA